MFGVEEALESPCRLTSPLATWQMYVDAGDVCVCCSIHRRGYKVLRCCAARCFARVRAYIARVYVNVSGLRRHRRLWCRASRFFSLTRLVALRCIRFGEFLLLLILFQLNDRDETRVCLYGMCVFFSSAGKHHRGHERTRLFFRNPYRQVVEVFSLTAGERALSLGACVASRWYSLV